jgi:hypothetical protein
MRQFGEESTAPTRLKGAMVASERFRNTGLNHVFASVEVIKMLKYQNLWSSCMLSRIVRLIYKKTYFMYCFVQM